MFGKSGTDFTEQFNMHLLQWEQNIKMGNCWKVLKYQTIMYWLKSK